MEPFPLVSHGARLRAFLMRPSPGMPLLVFCHGFPGRNFNDAVARELHALGYGALLFRYRGAHGSEGAYSFRGNEDDIRVAVEAVRPHAPDGIGLLGYSLGGFHATRVLAQDASLARFLVLQAPFGDVGGMRSTVGDQMWAAFLATAQGLLNAPTHALIEEGRSLLPEEEAVSMAERIRAPAIVLHGTDDRLVPFEHGRRLHAALAGPKRLVAIEGADHDLAGQHGRIAREVHAFLREQGIVAGKA